MLTIKSLLNKIKWHKNLKQEDYFLYYHDRISHDLKEIKFIDIDDIVDNFIIIKKNNKKIHIPLHRIKKVKEKNKTIWQR
jgi:uncharacterized protein (UPF0248 family)